MRVAVVDCGTNSTRLLVAEPGDPLRVLVREMRITRLGQDVDATGRLAEDALERTFATVAEYAAVWGGLDAELVRITATSAVRDAANADAFFRGVRERTGVEAEVLTGDAEGGLTYAGATRLLDVARPVVVLDIGGGSTELVRGEDEPQAGTSRQLGSVRLTERALRSDPPTTGERMAATAIIDAELDEVERLVNPAAASTLVAVAGTATTVTALHLGLERYDAERIHGASIPAPALHELTQRLLAMTVAERAALGPVAPGREDVLHAGALILDRVVARFGFAEAVASEADVLDGLALDLLGLLGPLGG